MEVSLNRATKSLPIILSVFVSMVAQAHPGPTRVLFIGSYTYFNDLPEMFAKLAEAGPVGKVETEMVAAGRGRKLTQSTKPSQ
jgi:hypothetical protein